MLRLSLVCRCRVRGLEIAVRRVEKESKLIKTAEIAESRCEESALV